MSSKALRRSIIRPFTKRVALGGAPRELLYNRMKTAVTGEGDDGGIIYNASLIGLARHYGFHPKACQAYRAKTKGKVERPFRYIHQDFSWRAPSVIWRT